MTTYKKLLPFFLIFVFVLLLYYPALTTYFSHDDFFHFQVSLTGGSLGEFINFFGFHPFEERKIAFYRPLFREVFYNSFYGIFGLNPLPFRLLAFLIHFLNIFLVFRLIKKLFNINFIAFFTAFFFAITAANISPLYYLAGGIQTQGATLFVLLTLLFYIKFLDNGDTKYIMSAFLTFLLALASHEQSAVLPILMAGLIFLRSNFRDSVRKIYILWPFFVIVALYIYLNITIIGYSSAESQYKMVFNPKTAVQTLIWYAVWSFGIPEMLQDFLMPGFKLNPNLMRYWGGYYRYIFPSFFAAAAIFGILSLYLVIKSKNIYIDKRFIFLAAWFPLGILPVIFLPQHKSTHYVYPSLAAFWGTIGYLTYYAYKRFKSQNKLRANILFGIFTASLIMLSTASALLQKTTYWAAARGRAAEKIIKGVKSAYPQIPKGSAIYFKNDPDYPYVSESWGGTSKQAFFALNGNDALQLLYKDFTLSVHYEDFDNFDDEMVNNSIYIITAPIP